MSPILPLPRRLAYGRSRLCSHAPSLRKAGAYVVLSAAINRKADYPPEFRDAVLFEHDGGSCIIDPRGEVIAGPVKGDETILTASASLDLVRSVKAVIDVGGHYSRPDVFEFKVKEGPADPL